MTPAAVLVDLGDPPVQDEPVRQALAALAALRAASGPLRVSAEALRAAEPAALHDALSRLAAPADLSAALFVSADAAQVAAARRLGVTAWQRGVELTDWSQLALHVAHAIGETDPARLRAAFALRVRSLYDAQLAELQRVEPAAHRAFATLAGEPAQAVVLELDARGDVTALRHVDETARERGYHEALEATAAVAEPGAELAPGQTHTTEPGPGGPAPRRKRFSII